MGGTTSRSELRGKAVGLVGHARREVGVAFHTRIMSNGAGRSVAIGRGDQAGRALMGLTVRFLLAMHAVRAVRNRVDVQRRKRHRVVTLTRSSGLIRQVLQGTRRYRSTKT